MKLPDNYEFVVDKDGKRILYKDGKPYVAPKPKIRRKSRAKKKEAN